MSAQLHQGGCHCRAIRYEATIDLSHPVITCNCSICRSKGLMLGFTSDDGLTVTEGGDALSEYRFYTHKVVHRFCPTCGVEVFARVEGKGNAINVRTLDAVDIGSLETRPFDGASL